MIAGRAGIIFGPLSRARLKRQSMLAMIDAAKSDGGKSVTRGGIGRARLYPPYGAIVKSAARLYV